MKKLLLTILLFGFTGTVKADQNPRGVWAVNTDSHFGSVDVLDMYGVYFSVTYNFSTSDLPTGSKQLSPFIAIIADVLPISDEAVQRLYQLGGEVSREKEIAKIIGNSFEGSSLKFSRKNELYASCSLREKSLPLGTYSDAYRHYVTVNLSAFRCKNALSNKAIRPRPRLGDRVKFEMPTANISVLKKFQYFY